MAFGALLGQTASGGGGKRVCRFTVGTSTAGWTSNDCDYLCDGTADDVEINAAIQALPAEGGEIVILDGTYNITATIAMNKDNVTLSGNGSSTVLKRMWDSSKEEGVITVNAVNGGCVVGNLQIDGNRDNYLVYNIGIYLSNSDNNVVTGNICNNNGMHGIYLINSNNNTITENICNNNIDYGINLNNSDNNVVTGNASNNNDTYGIYIVNSVSNTVTGNICDNNDSDGIHLSFTSNIIITGNTCNNNHSGIYIGNSDNNTVVGNTCNNNIRYGVSMHGSDNDTVTGNTCNNNNTGIDVTNSDNNTVVGNTCIRGTGQSSNYTSSQYTIRLSGTGNNYNLISSNNIMGKNYVDEGGTGNTFVNNKYN